VAALDARDGAPGRARTSSNIRLAERSANSNRADCCSESKGVHAGTVRIVRLLLAYLMAMASLRHVVEQVLGRQGALEVQQEALAVLAPAVAADPAGRWHDPVAGHHDGNRVDVQGIPRSTRRTRRAG